MYTIYIIELSDNSYYCGIAKDLNKRINAHIRGKGSKYVKARLPIKKLLYSETANNRSEAQKREWAIKKLSRKEKERLINEKSTRNQKDQSEGKTSSEE